MVQADSSVVLRVLYARDMPYRRSELVLIGVFSCSYVSEIPRSLPFAPCHRIVC